MKVQVAVHGQIFRRSILALAATASLVVVLVRPPLAQDPAYHVMADHRTLLGIPNCLNVLSNLPFAAVGLLGLAVVFRRSAGGPTLFLDPWERWPYFALFVGTALTAFGSAYYHLAPGNGRLVWDRLPMTLAFMGLLTALIAERVSLQVGRKLLGPLLVLGASSVLYWYWGELRGSGDLRFYILVQFGSLLLVVLLMILYPARYPGAGYVFAGLAVYAVAKWLEFADQRIFAVGQIVSGHTLKHLAAAAGVSCIAAMLWARRPASSPAFRDGHLLTTEVKS
jgi:hypothetical protein